MPIPSTLQQFRIAMPLATHYERATCADVDCPQYLAGWETIIPAGSEAERFLRTQAITGMVDGIRRYVSNEERTPDGMVKFTFPAGQPCFKQSQHRQPTGRDPLFYHDTARRSLQLRPVEFNEEFNEQAYRVSRSVQRG